MLLDFCNMYAFFSSCRFSNGFVSRTADIDFAVPFYWAIKTTLEASEHSRSATSSSRVSHAHLVFGDKDAAPADSLVLNYAFLSME
jgi:hypothetical protein